jgi:hypothetical protein
MRRRVVLIFGLREITADPCGMTNKKTTADPCEITNKKRVEREEES